MQTTMVHLSLKSGNGKTGPIPVTTTPRSTCPRDCAHRGATCYMETGGSSIFWSHVDLASESADGRHVHSDSRGREYTTRVVSWGALVAMVERGDIPPGLARLGQGGDLPGDGAYIDRDALVALARASARAGVRWIIYTHYLTGVRDAAALMANLRTIRAAMAEGMVVNASCDSVEDVRLMRALGLRTAVTMPSTWTARVRDADDIVQCPATYRETGPGSNCAACGLCAVGAEGRATVGFPAHGARHRTVDARLALFAREGVAIAK